MSDKKTYWEAFYIKENDEPYKNKWIPIGIAFDNADESINVNLHCSPVNGRIHLRRPRPKTPNK